MKPTVCIDPGHGGKDSGAVGASNGYFESHGVLNIALMVRDILRPHINVELTRSNDEFLSLSERCKLANQLSKCTAFISIHLNSASNPGAEGWEVFTSGSNNSRILSANIANSHLYTFPEQKNRGVKEATFYVLRHTTMPACLWEGCFMSNDKESKWVAEDDTQKKMAQAISNGILNYYGIESQNNNRQLTLEERVAKIEKQLNIT